MQILPIITCTLPFAGHEDEDEPMLRLSDSETPGSPGHRRMPTPMVTSIVNLDLVSSGPSSPRPEYIYEASKPPSKYVT